MSDTAYKIEVMQACEDGEKIQFKPIGGAWEDTDKPGWEWQSYDYRIKPEKKELVLPDMWPCWVYEHNGIRSYLPYKNNEDSNKYKEPQNLFTPYEGTEKPKELVNDEQWVTVEREEPYKRLLTEKVKEIDWSLVKAYMTFYYEE